MFYKLYIFFFPPGFNNNEKKFLIKKLKLKNKLTVFDIGSYVSAFSGRISRIFKKKKINFHLFDPNIADVIKNKKNHSFIYNNIAIGNKVGFSKFYLNDFFPSSGSSLLDITKKDFLWNLSRKIITLNFFGKFFLKKVKVETIDRYVTLKKIRIVDILKIDTEGSELLVLQGAKKTLKKTSIIFIEIMGEKKNFYIKEKKIFKILFENNFNLIKKTKIKTVSILSRIKCFDYIFIKNV